MVIKTMSRQKKICQQCGQSQGCQQAYQQLGHLKGPSVAWKVVVAFLGPMVVFITSLVVFESILAKWSSLKEPVIILNFLSALTVTFMFILIVRVVDKRSYNNKHIIS